MKFDGRANLTYQRSGSSSDAMGLHTHGGQIIYGRSLRGSDSPSDWKYSCTT